jgi:hypothetical protein
VSIAISVPRLILTSTAGIYSSFINKAPPVSRFYSN